MLVLQLACDRNARGFLLHFRSRISLHCALIFFMIGAITRRIYSTGYFKNVGGNMHKKYFGGVISVFGWREKYLELAKVQ